MPWMCLERCGDNLGNITQQMQSIHDHLDLITGVSFEMYNLGPNSQLVKNNFTSVGPQIRQWGLETFPMVSSYPYPPDFLDWMRQLFNNPTPFINAALKEASINGWSGLNLDFEPTAKGTPQDAIDYANFLTKFANILHKQGLKLTIDVASWNTLWNYTLLSQSTVDRIFTMDTYTAKFSYFQQSIAKAVQQIDLNKLGIGLETVKDNNNQPFSQQEIQERFDLIAKYSVIEIDIWKMGIPDNWWSFISTFVNTNVQSIEVR